MRTPSLFSQRVCELALSIPRGRVTTYGILSRAAGGTAPRQAQMITSILSRSELAYKMPYHRIVYSDGRVWIDPEHRVERMKLYKSEGIGIDARDRIVDFEKLLYEFD